jgi:hypothetical protein
MNSFANSAAAYRSPCPTSSKSFSHPYRYILHIRKSWQHQPTSTSFFSRYSKTHPLYPRVEAHDIILKPLTSHTNASKHTLLNINYSISASETVGTYISAVQLHGSVENPGFRNQTSYHFRSHTHSFLSLLMYWQCW